MIAWSSMAPGAPKCRRDQPALHHTLFTAFRRPQQAGEEGHLPSLCMAMWRRLGDHESRANGREEVPHVLSVPAIGLSERPSMAQHVASFNHSTFTVP